MKHVRRLEAEPPALAGYRHDWPTEENRPQTEASKVWSHFRDTPSYRDLLHSLVEVQQGLCLYCEQRIVDAAGALIPNDYQIEHVLPKSGGPRRTLDWTNLALACGGGTYAHHRDESRTSASTAGRSCGQSKEDNDLPPGCDPRDLPLLGPVVRVGLDGRLTANAERQALATTIDHVLNLNCERLRKARQDTGDNVRAWLLSIVDELTGNLQPAQREQLLDLVISGRLGPDGAGCLRRFWSAERCALGQPAEAWLAANQELFT